MNYRILTDTASPRLLAEFNKKIEFKPNVGDVVTIGLPQIPWVITRETPNSTTLQGDNRSFDFFASVQNTTPDSTSMRNSNDNIQRKLNMFG